jgi:acetylornithine deacetylase/succinyl-diaminopimelate desuccinylase-like protein
VKRGSERVGGALGGDVALDGEGELGEVAVADDASELGLGFEMARLLARLEAYRSPVHIAPEVEPILDAVAAGDGTLEERLAAARDAHPALDRILAGLVGTVIHPTVLEASPPHNQIPPIAQATLACIVLPGTTADDLEAELRDALGDADYDLEVVAPKGGLVSDADTPLRDAIEDFLAEHDPDARLIPALGYGYSDCDVMRQAYDCIAYGFIPFRHADPMTNLESKHGADERVLIADLIFQTRAAIAVAETIGALEGDTRHPRDPVAAGPASRLG